MSRYDTFLREKVTLAESVGMTEDAAAEFPLAARLFDWQEHIVRWAIGRGSAAIFADTGLGKTGMQLAWADAVRRYTGRPVLILAPIAVAPLADRILARRLTTPTPEAGC